MSDLNIPHPISSFLALPREIRDQILSYIIAEPTQPPTLWTPPPDAQIPPHPSYPGCCENYHYQRPPPIYEIRLQQTTCPVAALMQTCHRLYAEVCELEQKQYERLCKSSEDKSDRSELEPFSPTLYLAFDNSPRVCTARWLRPLCVPLRGGNGKPINTNSEEEEETGKAVPTIPYLRIILELPGLHPSNRREGDNEEYWLQYSQRNINNIHDVDCGAITSSMLANGILLEHIIFQLLTTGNLTPGRFRLDDARMKEEMENAASENPYMKIKTIEFDLCDREFRDLFPGKQIDWVKYSHYTQRSRGFCHDIIGSMVDRAPIHYEPEKFFNLVVSRNRQGHFRMDVLREGGLVEVVKVSRKDRWAWSSEYKVGRDLKKCPTGCPHMWLSHMYGSWRMIDCSRLPIRGG